MRWKFSRVQEKREVDLTYPYTLFSAKPIFLISSWIIVFSISEAHNMIYIELKIFIGQHNICSYYAHKQKDIHRINGWNMKANLYISLHLCSHWMQVRKCPSSVFSILFWLQIPQRHDGQNQSPSGMSYTCRMKLVNNNMALKYWIEAVTSTQNGKEIYQ
jgi:hypothetical protein